MCAELFCFIQLIGLLVLSFVSQWCESILVLWKEVVEKKPTKQTKKKQKKMQISLLGAFFWFSVCIALTLTPFVHKPKKRERDWFMKIPSPI